jgi:predicted CXXCH cytochrome family protein
VLAQVTTLIVRKNGSVSKRPISVNADYLRFGRSTASEVLLPDIRVGLNEAELRRDDEGRLTFNQVGNNPIRVNGAPVGAAELKIGDVAQIGPYEVRIVEPADGFEVGVTVQLVESLGDDLARLQRLSTIGLDKTWLNRRGASWVFFSIVALLFFALPIGAYFADRVPGLQGPVAVVKQAAFGKKIPAAVNLSWNAGEIANPHKSFSENCQACHTQPFTMVKDQACLTCHGNVGHHADPRVVKVAALESTRCGTCHQEHNGPRGMVIRSETLCTDCHLDIKKTAPQTDLANVGEFGKAHPPFRLTLVADAARKSVVRVAFDPNEAKPTDKPNLKFPHDEHLDSKRWPASMKRLVCADCHTVEPGGAGMLPISFDKHCASCHKESLKFDSAALDRSVPHGNAQAAQRYVEDFYARVALEGKAVDPQAPEVVRRRPGRVLAEPERLEALDWASKKALTVRDFIFDDKRGCGTCHTVDRDPAGYRIEPVMLQQHFLPKAEFNHAKHNAMQCADCHAAKQSSSSGDVLIPTIDNCTTCHGGEKANAKVPSTCISCHDFHRHDLGPMRTERTAELKP